MTCGISNRFFFKRKIVCSAALSKGALAKDPYSQSGSSPVNRNKAAEFGAGIAGHRQGLAFLCHRSLPLNVLKMNVN
jgi:hypothetical protein